PRVDAVHRVELARDEPGEALMPRCGEAGAVEATVRQAEEEQADPVVPGGTGDRRGEAAPERHRAVLPRAAPAQHEVVGGAEAELAAGRVVDAPPGVARAEEERAEAAPRVELG